MYNQEYRGHQEYMPDPREYMPDPREYMPDPRMQLEYRNQQQEYVRKMQDLETLRHIISQWNANRLDLFELSMPNEVGSCGFSL